MKPGTANLTALFNHVTANDNAAEGMDIDQAGAGQLRVELHNVTSNDPLDVTD